MSSISAAANLKRRLSNRLLIIGIYTFIVFAGGGGLTYMSYQLSTKLSGDIQQKVNANLSDEGVKTLQAFIASNPAAAELLIKALPNNISFPEVIADLEALTEVYDVKREVQVPNNSPVKVKTELTIPMQIKLTTSATNISELLKQIEQLPYIIEITNLDLQMPTGQGGLINCTLGVRIYVQEPFTAS